MRVTLATIVLLLAAATAAGAAALDLPVSRPDSPIAPPFYRGDVIELQLAPAAASAARATRTALTRASASPRGGVTAQLGVGAVDAVAFALGARGFEPEFVGETPGSGGTDLSAFHVVHLGAGVSLEDALDRFRALPEVLSADPIAVLPVSAAPPDDSLFARQKWMYEWTTPRHDDRALDAWDVQRGDTSIVVGILDTGLLAWHPDLGGTAAGGHGNLFVNWAEAGGVAGVDDDANGFVDDVSGWDFVDSLGFSVPTGEDGSGKDNDPSDVAGHGTAVSGIIGALVHNASGIAGMVPNVRLLPVRCAYATGVRPAAGVDMLAAARAIAYATRMGASVLNCSWESLDQNGLGAAVTNAVRAGVVFVNASGNRISSGTYLGQREDVISVAGVDSTDVMWANSTRGTWLDLCAQAVGITSTFVQGTGPDSLGYRQPDYRGGLVGTSFAAPQVTGAVALMQAQRRAQGRDPYTAIGAALRVRETADDHHAINPLYLNIGTGRLNVLRALTDPPTSFATRTKARSVGAPVALRLNDGTSRVVFATSDRQLVALEGAFGDTLWRAALPNAPAGHPAAAPIGNGRIGIFVGCAGGMIAGFDANGAALPGWPRTGLGGTLVASVGDLDGDAVPEIVAVSSDGVVWAMRTNGAVLAGFPYVSGVLGGSVALADLDAQPGREIVFLDGNSVLHAFTSGGAELQGWPVAAPTASRAPIVVALGTRRETAVIVAGSGRMDAITAAGNVRWSNTYTGNPSQDPIAGDLDGDGVDEVLVAISNPLQLRAVDSSGVALARTGWPLTLTAAPGGALVMGPMMNGGRACVGWFTSAGFVAYDDSARAVPGFPRPGLAGVAPNVSELDGDGATEIAMGVATGDSAFYAFDAGAASWNAANVFWPTVRGDNARTADRSSPGTIAPLDVTRPAPVADVLAQATGTRSARVTWTMTGDDSLTGRAASVDLRYTTTPLDETSFLLAAQWPVGTPDSSGALMQADVTGLQEGRTYFFALRVRDDAGLASALSNVDTVRTPGLRPGPVTDLRVGALRDTVVTLRWTATGDDGASGRPDHYTIVANLVPVTDGNFDAAPMLWQRAATADAGAPESLVVNGLARGKRWYFALRATDAALSTSDLSNAVSVVTPMGGALGARTGLALAPSSRPSRLPVVFTWQLGDAASGPAVLSLYDLGGRQVLRVRLAGELGGTWEWNGRDAESRLVPAGLYFARLESGSRHTETRVVLLR
ncbi:MAG: S8 family serine peptidase [Candidatus Eisenbacteria bacterium]|uniref:S8 family serine peptidase n=1 Tax=Eiseniibacteriota bacterium TaxID=2212470 RepID=A0A933SGP6_UNCEI|nr:S8 family serine peptidase [Candidatus Eisenbacteria bacterium]